jgi:type II secretory ATPase GspE/PulE/Tfp pilus assembly ATPase PilB-like protein
MSVSARALAVAEPSVDPAAGSAVATSASFRWPTPPYAAYPCALEQANAEDCILTSHRGRNVVGRLTYFAPEQGCLEFQFPRAPSAETIPFGDIKMLCLMAPLRLECTGTVLAALGPEADARPHPQKFVVDFTAGDKLEGHTLGHVREPFGLFLFRCLDSASEPNVEVERVFVPHQSIHNFSIGECLGQLLIEERIVEPGHVEQALAHQQQLRTQRIGDYLVASNIVTEDQLLEAIRRQESMPVMRLGEALIELGLLKPDQLAAALARQKENRSKLLGQILIEMGLITDDDLRMVLARKLGFPVVSVSNFPVDVTALKAIPDGVARRLRVLPLIVRDGMLVIALEDPLQADKLNEIRFMTQLKVVPVIATRHEVEGALRRFYGSDTPWSSSQAGDGGESDQDSDADGVPGFDRASTKSRADINELASALDAETPLRSDADDVSIQESDNTLVRLVNTMILDAYSQGASDIHVESYPDRQKMRIRFRKDGTLYPYLELPASYRSAIIARIKIMSDLDISERRKPQDGKIDFQRFGPAKIELRVATIPTSRGLEDVVLRILAAAKPVPLGNLGLSPHNLENVRKIMSKSYGLVLVCGPTGSGKTTTLHSALSYINVPERKIWTAEDPVEITQPGLRQVQVNPKIGWTFAGALRAFLRADPDVIMVGEMRDLETARVGVEASLTGHLVLSTLHTNSAPESITRLLDMGLDPFNFADALLGVLAQRLAKRLCPSCRTTHDASEAELEELLDDYCFGTGDMPEFSRQTVKADWQEHFGTADGRIKLYRSKGCSTCSGTGYRGRLALHELLVGSAHIKRLAQTGARVEEIHKTALQEGMRSLKQDGIIKILQGDTDLLQVRAVTN